MISSFLILPLVASIVHGYAQSSPQRSHNRRLIQRGAAIKGRDASNNSVPAVWNNGVEMLTPVTIAGKTFNMVLDTGSDDL